MNDGISMDYYDILLRYKNKTFKFQARYMVLDRVRISGEIHTTTNQLVLMGKGDIDIPMGSIVVILVDGQLFKCDLVSRSDKEEKNRSRVLNCLTFRIENRAQLAS